MKKFYDRYWEGRSPQLQDFIFKWPRLAALIPRKPCVLLDYGCGKGRILSEVRHMNPSARLYGADISKTALKIAKKYVPSAQFFLIDGHQRVNVRSYSCDFVLSLDVIEHVYDTENMFYEFNRLIKKGGYLLISTPYYGLIKNILIAFVGFNTVYEPTTSHIRFYTHKTLLSLLQKFGFLPVKTGKYGRFFPVHNGMYVLARKVKNV